MTYVLSIQSMMRMDAEQRPASLPDVEWAGTDS